MFNNYQSRCRTEKSDHDHPIVEALEICGKYLSCFRGCQKYPVKTVRQMVRQFLGKKSNYSKYFIALLLKEQDRRGQGGSLNVFQMSGSSMSLYENTKIVES